MIFDPNGNMSNPDKLVTIKGNTLSVDLAFSMLSRRLKPKRIIFYLYILAQELNQYPQDIPRNSSPMRQYVN